MEKQCNGSATAQLTVLAEGRYTLALPEDKPATLAELLGELGISQRDSQWYMGGKVESGDAVVHPGDEIVILPRVYGG